jgi:hypothetical protein
MKTLTTLACMILVCMMVAPARAQQLDLAFGGGSLMSSGNSGSSANSATFSPAEGGGSYVGFSGDVLFKGNLGAEGEVFWKGSQGLYGGELPDRPIFYDFNAIYARRLDKYFGAEALGGIGGESIRFYQGSFSCDEFGDCSNYLSSSHFMGDVGGGIRLYAYHNFFVRPEVRLYLIHNNVEFSSSHPVRYGVSIGYTFGGSQGGLQ